MDIHRVFESIDEEEILSTAEALIRIPSHFQAPEKEREISRFVRDRLQTWGFSTTLQEVEKDRYNVIAKLEGHGGGKSLALNGHLDTVPPGREMKTPYDPRRAEGRLYGRGACDMKGTVAAMLYTLYVLKSRGIQLKGDLYFAGVAGEETAGIGTRFLVRNGFQADFAVVGEPTSLHLAVSHKGVFQAEIRVRGRAAHASIPDKGVNAISAVSDFIQVVEKELMPELHKRQQEQVGSATLNFGLIEGGEKANMVADFCRLQLDRRWVKYEALDQVISEIESIMRRVCERDQALSWEVIPLHPADGYFGPFVIPENHELVQRAKVAMKEAGITPRIVGVPYWSDAATLMHGGIPSIVLGAGSISQAHSDEEYVEIDQLVGAAKCYLALTKSVCGWR